MIAQHIHKSIKEAAIITGKTWPLYAFVTSNPLSGYEKKPFEEAVGEVNTYLGGNVFPNPLILNNALKSGEIDKKELNQLFLENGFTKSPKYYLNEIINHKQVKKPNPYHTIDRVMAKWLAAFLLPFLEKQWL